jgi:hypothetical protein
VTDLLPYLALATLVLAGGLGLAARRSRATRAAAPLTPVRSLRGASGRLTALRAALAALLAACLALAAAQLGRPQDGYTDLLSDSEATVVVLDVSASVSELVYREIARTLRGLVDTAGDSRRIGLVVFSDVAVEALPPGSRAAELEPYVRYFLPKRELGASRKPSYYRAAGPTAQAPIPYPQNPWFRRFSGGTHISTGLAAAREALARDAGGAGRVLLLSDLAEAREDLGPLAEELAAFSRDPRLELEIVALPPATEVELALFRRTLGSDAEIRVSTELATGASPGGGAAFPVWAAILAGLAALGLAANELLRPLAWRPLGGETP